MNYFVSSQSVLFRGMLGCKVTKGTRCVSVLNMLLENVFIFTTSELIKQKLRTVN